MKKFIAVLVWILGTGIGAYAQTPAPTQHFVCATTGGTLDGNAVAIATCGTQVTSDLSVAYEFISNPSDSSKTRVGSGLANYTFALASLVPSSVKKKLLIDLTNYNLTLQAGAGVESLSNGVGNPRIKHVVGNFGIFPSYPLPGGHAQIGAGPKWIVGPQGGVIKGFAATLNFTF